MSITPHDAIILCLDVGKTVSVINPGEERTFFDQSKDCASWIIQRKLISQSPDVLSLLLIGSDEDGEHSMTNSGYQNISCKFDFQYGSWDMLKFVTSEMKTTQLSSDWMGALIVSMEMLKAYEEFNQVVNKKIVLFSDFKSSVSDNLNVVCKNLKRLQVSITIIGPQNISALLNDKENTSEPLAKRQKANDGNVLERLKGEELVCQLWKKVPDLVTICSFHAALKQLGSFTKKALRKTPWNCLLDIGDVKINVSMFKKTDPKASKKLDTKFVRTEESQSNSRIMASQVAEEDTVAVVRDKVMHYERKRGDTGEIVHVEVEEEDTIEGFRYGNSIVPFADADKAVMTYKPGPKSFSVIGFTKLSSVPFYLLSGECSYLVLPREKDKNAEVAFSAIVQAMNKLECLAVVRRVYSNDRGLSLGILYPFLEEVAGEGGDEEEEEVMRKESLIYIELAFDDEVKSVSFPSLEKFAKTVTKDQYDAVDQLIDKMNLMNADVGFDGEACEAFDSTSLHDFKDQFYNHCVIQRGLYPDKPLPQSVPSYIEDYIRVPRALEKAIEIPLKEVKEKFPIHVVEPAEREKESGEPGDVSGANVTGDKEGRRRHFSELSIEREKDSLKKGFMKLLACGFPGDEELEEFLIGSQTNSKTGETIGEVVREVRELYLKGAPDRFNWWMTNLKRFCHTKGGSAGEIWNAIVKGNLGLVSREENMASRVTEAEAEQFMHTEVTKSLTCASAMTANDFESCSDELDELIKDHFIDELMAKNQL